MNNDKTKARKIKNTVGLKRNKKSYFGKLKGIGKYNREEDRAKDRIGQLD